MALELSGLSLLKNEKEKKSLIKQIELQRWLVL